MQLVLDIPVAINFISAILAVSVLTYLFGQKPVRGIHALRLLMAALAWWALCNTVELAILDPSTKVFLSKMSYFGVAVTSPTWVIFALAYRDKLQATSRWFQRGLWFTSLLILVAVFTNDLHHGIWVSTLPDPASDSRIIYRHGVLLIGYAVVAYLMLVFGAFVLIRSPVAERNIHRKQSTLMVMASLFPLLGNVAYLARLLPWPELDPTPVMFIFSGLFISIAVRRYHMFDLLPVARERLFDVLQDVVIVLDRNGRLADMNDAAKQLLSSGKPHPAGGTMALDEVHSLQKGIAVKTSDPHLKREEPETLFPLLKPVITALPAGLDAHDTHVPDATVFQLDNGRWYDVRHAPLTGKSDQKEGCVLTLRDITLRKQAELQLLEEKRQVEAQRQLADDARKTAEEARTGAEQARQAAEEARISADLANRAKSAFLTNMSHEMRTPLVAITGYLSLLEETGLQPEQRQHVREVASASEGLLALVNEMLDLSRIEAGRMELDRVPMRMDSLLEECASLVSVRLLGKPVDLIVENQLETPVLVGDRGRIRQMILNLLGNAVKFTETGTIHALLRLAQEKEIPDTHQVAESVETQCWMALEIRDTGPGIAEDVAPRLFEPFVQANADITRKYGGSGLGLAITARIAEAMGGVIRLESWPGLGSVFVMVLPMPVLPLPAEGLRPVTGRTLLVRQGQRVSAEQPVVAEPNEGTSREAPATLDKLAPASLDSLASATLQQAPRHVLVAEDTAANLRLIVHLLERLGYRVTAAKTGLEAVDRFGESMPDLVLMDIQMPVMDGLEATRFIRSLESGTRRTPILAMTANAMEGERQACFDAGMDDFLVKPVRLDQLRERLQHWISR